MRINRLYVSGFRHLVEQEINLESDAVLLIGRNAQGKTSVLEAAYFLAHGKSFRSSRAKEVLPWNTEVNKSISEGDFQTRDGSKQLRVEITASERLVFLNDKAVTRAQSFYGQVACAVFTPDDLQLIKGAPALRRRFLDRLLAVVDGLYVEHLVHYQRTIKQRNSLLAKASRENWSSTKVAQSLRPWTLLLLEHGQQIAARRKSALEHLLPRIVEYYRILSGASATHESVGIKIVSDFIYKDNLSSSLSLLESYESSFKRDCSRQITTFGIHRDDLYLSLNCGSGEREARVAASQGQSRCFALALVLAGIDYIKEHLGESPIVLLDDVESELDSYRREALSGLITESKSQVIVTATEASQAFLSKTSGTQVFAIEQGKVRAL